MHGLKQAVQRTILRVPDSNLVALNLIAVVALVVFLVFVLMDTRLQFFASRVPAEPTSMYTSALTEPAATTIAAAAPVPSVSLPSVQSATPIPNKDLVIPWRPLVTLCFDDTNDTAYTLAYPLLERYGLEAGVVVVTNLVGQDSRLSWPQVGELDRAGWDIIDGTLSHPDTPTISDAQLDVELQVSQAMIESHIGTGKVRGLVWPYNDAGDKQLAVARRYFDWAASGASPLDGGFLLRHGLPASQAQWPYRLWGGVAAAENAKNGDITQRVRQVVDGPMAWFMDFERVEPFGAEGLNIDVSDVQKLIDYLLANDAVIVKPSEFYRILRYGKPEYLQAGFELIRNRQFTRESATTGVPSSFEVESGTPKWFRTGGPSGSGYLQVTDQSIFRTVELPVLAGGNYRFSFQQRADTSVVPETLASVGLLDSSSQVVSTQDSRMPVKRGQWSQAHVDFAVPQGIDEVRLQVASADSGTVSTAEWSLIRR